MPCLGVMASYFLWFHLQHTQGVGVDLGIGLLSSEPAGLNHQVEVTAQQVHECGREEPLSTVVHPVVGEYTGLKSLGRAEQGALVLPLQAFDTTSPPQPHFSDLPNFKSLICEPLTGPGQQEIRRCSAGAHSQFAVPGTQNSTVPMQVGRELELRHMELLGSELR